MTNSIYMQIQNNFEATDDEVRDVRTNEEIARRAMVGGE